MKCLFKMILVALSVLLVLSSVGCAGDDSDATADNAINTKGVVMSYGDETLDAKEFRFIAAYIKDNVIYNQQYYLQQYTGVTYTEEQILAMNVDEKRTFGQYIEDYAIEFSQQLLIIKSLCNKSNIVITEQEDIDEIADYISGIEAAFGGKDYFEIELSDLGFSREGIKKLKEYSYLYDLLFDSRYGKNGTAKLPEVDVKKYFVENYIRCDGVFYSYYNEGAPIKYEYTDDEIEEYFNDKYVKVRHILYSTTNLSKEKAEAKKQKATDAFNAIKNGEKLFEDFVKDNEDSGSEYVFTYGKMVKPFEEASFEMQIGEVRLVETEYGFHIVEKLEKTNEDLFGKVGDDGKTTGGVKNAVIENMSSQTIRAEALEILKKLQNGELTEYPKKSDDKKYYNVIESTFLRKDDANSEFFIKALEKQEKDVYFDCELYGTYILRNLAFTGDDITSSIYSSIEESLSVEAFYEYVQSFYDDIEINEDKIEQIQILKLPSLSNSFFVNG